MAELEPLVITDWRGTRVLLPTRYGIVVGRWTRGNHVHVAAGRGDEGTCLVYRDREWNVSMHLFAVSGWGESRGDPEEDRHRHVFTSWDAARGKIRDIAPTWRAAIAAEVSAVVAEFVAAHPEIPAQAEVEHLESELARARRRADEARTAYQQADADAHQLGTLLERARAALEKALAPAG